MNLFLRLTRLKGFPGRRHRSTGWSIFDPSVLMPTAVLLQSALLNNSKSFARFCEQHHVSFAPHGKTTMSPELFRIQLRDGAWAITAATAFQARTMIEHGVSRVFIANEVVAPGDIAWLADATHDGREVYCCVDSLAAVKILDSGLAGLLKAQQVPVLVELGVPQGRTGTRSVIEALAVAQEVSISDNLCLVGASGFEGIITATETQSAEERVNQFLADLRRLVDEMIALNMLRGVDDVLLAAGGSVYFDQVVEQLYRETPIVQERVIVRSGCYISHDDGVIHELSPLGAVQRTPGDVFQAALEIWGVVLSRPEPTRVIVGVGKRDASTDGLLPIAKKMVRKGGTQPEPWSSLGRAVRVDDQHAYLEVAPSEDIAVGDFVGFGISHPCTTFDKWRAIPIVDDNYRVVNIANTFF